jgi:DNA-binding transcriptional regulator LsrR (DeoR family)
MNETELLIKIAKLYFNQKMTYAEIGEVIHVSRFTVSRLLQKAKDQGIVEIKIHEKWEQNEDLAKQLCKKFSLKDAVVLKRHGRSGRELCDGLGYLAAIYLDQKLQPGWILGVSWGRTLDSLVSRLEPSVKKNIKVVQMMGHAGLVNPKIDGPDLVRRLAEKYEGEYFYLPAPLIVEDIQLKENLIEQPRIKNIIEMASHANILVSGIGELELENYSVWSGYLTFDDIVYLKNSGAVGHICGQFYDSEGRLLDVEINKRFVGMKLEDISNVDWAICVAGSNKRAEAIASGLRGRLFNVLITDDMICEQIL